MKNNIVAAVDIGTNSTVCMIGHKIESGKVKVLAHSMVPSLGVRRGVILNVEDVAKTVKNAIQKVTTEKSYNVKKLYVNVAGQHLQSIERNIHFNIDFGKIVNQSDIQHIYDEARKTKVEEGDKIYHVVNQSYRLDGEETINNPIGSTGKYLEATYRLVIGPADYEKKVEMSLESAGFEMVKCIVNPVAAAEAVLTDEEKETGVVLVDLGAGTSSISVFYECALRHIGVIPFGGNVVTNDIKEGCAILLRQAESLKVQFGAAMGEYAPEDRVVTIPGLNGWEPKEISFKSLAYIIQARLEEIFEAIYFQIEKSGYIDKLGAGIVLTGGGSQLEGIANLVRFKTGMDIRIGDPIMGFINEEEKMLKNPSFATVFGLLKMALSDERALNNKITRKRIAIPEKFTNDIVKKLSLFFEEDEAD